LLNDTSRIRISKSFSIFFAATTAPVGGGANPNPSYLSAGKWMSLIRANFLVLTVVSVLTGFSAAIYERCPFNAVNALLALVGALFAHISANVFNNYFDYKMGVDQMTVKTPFSGGVDVLVKGHIRPSTAFLFGLCCLLGAALVGIYFVRIFFWPMLAIVVYGGLSIYFYTPYLSRLHGVSEIIAGTNFGLMGLGAYVTQTGLISATALSVFVPVSILVGMLLFLNEFPDIEADRSAGRRHLMLLLGRKMASRLYVLLLVSVYISIVLPVLMGVTPLSSMIALATGPLAWTAGRIVVKSYDKIDSLARAMALNVLIVLGTTALISLGLLLGIFL